MTDNSKSLPVEKLDLESWKLDSNRRAAKMAALPSVTPQDKGMLRQMQDNNIARDYLEETLLVLNDIEVVGGTDGVKFTAGKKLTLQKNLRGALVNNYEQKSFLQLAKEYGYAAAEEFKATDNDDIAFNDDIKKRMEEIKKRYAGKTKQYTQNEMKRFNSLPNRQQQYPGSSIQGVQGQYSHFGQGLALQPGFASQQQMLPFPQVGPMPQVGMQPGFPNTRPRMEQP